MGRPAGSTNIPWDALVARARLHAGRWIIPPELASVPARTIIVIRLRQRHALRLDDGVIRCRAKARAWKDGREIVTLSIKFEKKEAAPDGTQAGR